METKTNQITVGSDVRITSGQFRNRRGIVLGTSDSHAIVLLGPTAYEVPGRQIDFPFDALTVIDAREDHEFVDKNLDL